MTLGDLHENAISFIPGGFRGEDVNTMNPVREEVGGDSALYGLVHVLTIPRKKFIMLSLSQKITKPSEETKALGEVGRRPKERIKV